MSDENLAGGCENGCVYTVHVSDDLMPRDLDVFRFEWPDDVGRP